MKNILIISSNYPAGDLPKGITPVVHMFAKEWVLMGYNVYIVHNYTVFPSFFYFFANHLNKLISNKVGSVIPKNKNNIIKKYDIDNVKVIRIPIFKFFPRIGFLKKSQESQLVKIIRELDKEKFIPEIVIGHWVSPQISLCFHLKRYFNIRSALIMHEVWPSIIKRDYKNDSDLFINDVDFWGYRSKTIKNRFEELYGVKKNSFLCYSGISSELIPEKIEKKFSQRLKSFVFVGTMLKRKFPEAILYALKNYKTKDELSIHYVGNGAMTDRLLHLAEECNLFKNIVMHGYIPRNDVRKLLFETECFIMISVEEAFGLVYIEAMANGCITVASRNEGFDGIILDGVNGFLCKAGDFNELEQIIDRINNLSLEEKIQISENAIQTARNMTENIVAKDYLMNIENIQP